MVPWISTSLGLVLLFCGAEIASAEPSGPTVQSSEILLALKAGLPVRYDGVSVEGGLDLSSLPEARAASSLIVTNASLRNTSFEGVTFEKEVFLGGTALNNVSFYNARFLADSDFSNASVGNCSFTGAVFDKPVSFDGAIIQDNVGFADSTFSKDTSFKDAIFKGDAEFNRTTFSYYTYFSGAQFLGRALFSNAKFLDALDFSSARFTGGTSFFQSEFQGWADFDESVFEEDAAFQQADFQGLSSFGDTTFGREADFNLAHFNGAAYFYRASFQGDVFFGLAKLEEVAGFEGASFEKNLNMKGIRGPLFLMEDAAFGESSKINLIDADYGRLWAPWKEIRSHVVYDAGAYLALVDNYRRLGWHGDEDDCYYDYRRLGQASKGLGWSKAIDVLAWLSCGYGVRPGYAVAWSILTILIFALVFWAGDGIRRSAKPLQGLTEVDPVPERASLRNALFFSTMIFLSQGPIDFLPVGRHRYYVILEGMLGWLLLALFLVTLGRIMIR
jgi:uncharacterized protein YjbI with pentapeptide repeats